LTNLDSRQKLKLNKRIERLTANKGLNAMGADVLNSTFVLLLNFGAKLNICASNPPLRQAPNRWATLYLNTAEK